MDYHRGFRATALPTFSVLRHRTQGQSAPSFRRMLLGCPKSQPPCTGRGCRRSVPYRLTKTTLQTWQPGLVSRESDLTLGAQAFVSQALPARSRGAWSSWKGLGNEGLGAECQVTLPCWTVATAHTGGAAWDCYNVHLNLERTAAPCLTSC